MNGREEYDGRADEGPLVMPLGESDETCCCCCCVLSGGVPFPPPFIEESASLCLLRVELPKEEKQRVGHYCVQLLGQGKPASESR